MKNKMQNEFGTRIATRRRELNLTQEELANRLGVTPQALSQYERGLRLPDVELLKSMCGLLQMSADLLLDTDFAKTSETNSLIFPEILRNNLAPLQIAFGVEIIPLFMQEDYVEQISVMRMNLAKCGILLPIVKIMDWDRLNPREFIITAYDNVIYQETLLPEQNYSLYYIFEKFENAVQDHYDEILSPDIIKMMTDNLKINHPALVDGVIPDRIPYIQLTNVCKKFLRRGNTLVYLPKIIETMIDLQRDNIQRNDDEWVEMIIPYIERKDNVWVYLAQRKNNT